MNRKYKLLGLAIGAMLALSAFAAQGASADPLTCGSATCFLTGEQEETFIFKTTGSGGEVKCPEAHFLSTGTATNNELTVTPSWPTTKKDGTNNCTAYGSPAHVTANGCTFTFTTPKKLKEGEVTFRTGSEENPLHFVCPTKPLEITPTIAGFSVCTQKVEGQTPTGGHVVGTNAGGATPTMDVTLDIAVTGIHYTGSGGVCGDGTTHSDADLNGKATVKCYSNELRTVQVDCTFS